MSSDNQDEFIKRRVGFTEKKLCAAKNNQLDTIGSFINGKSLDRGLKNFDLTKELLTSLEDKHSNQQNPDEALNETGIKDYLKSIVDLLPKANKETRLRWSSELVSKLDLIQEMNLEKNYKITLDCIKIDPDDNLTIDLIGSSFNGEIDDVYKTPEYFFGEPYDAEKSNIWSAGVCVYYIGNLSFPWKRASLSDARFRRWVSQKVFKDALEDSTMRALGCMLAADVKQRPCMKEVTRQMCRTSPNSSVISKIKLFCNFG